MKSSYRFAGVTAVVFRTHEQSGVLWTSTGSYSASRVGSFSEKSLLAPAAANRAGA